MARLPNPGSDEEQRSDIVNDFIAQTHKIDGTLKADVVTAAHLVPNAVDSTAFAPAGGAGEQVLTRSSSQDTRSKRGVTMTLRAGFTIVEILIVIVVIAILAALTIVAYTGVQERAYNTRVIAGVKQYYSAIEQYKARNGAYPPTSGYPSDPNANVALTCLGIGYPNNSCGTVTGQQINEDAIFNTAMSDFISTPASLGEMVIPVQGEAFVGAVYGMDLINKSGYSRGITLQWALLGLNQECVISGSWSYEVSTIPATTACEIILEPID